MVNEILGFSDYYLLRQVIFNETNHHFLSRVKSQIKHITDITTNN